MGLSFQRAHVLIFLPESREHQTAYYPWEKKKNEKEKNKGI